MRRSRRLQMNWPNLFILYGVVVITNAILLISCIREAMDDVEEIILFDEDDNPFAEGVPEFPVIKMVKYTFVLLIPIVHLITCFGMIFVYSREWFVDYLFDRLEYTLQCNELDEEEES